MSPWAFARSAGILRTMGGGRGRRSWGAFEQFCNDEHARIVGAVAVIIGDVDVAEDAVSEALARAWNRVRRGIPIESIAGWVRVVAINIARDHYRRRAVEKRRMPELVATTGVDSEYDGWGVSLDVRKAVAQLPTRQREVSLLYYFFDLTVAETAAELGISVATVKTCLERARTAFKASLGGRGEELVDRDAH
jgi:RNA polymerase sigma-70 factor (ECF subfamily)